MTLKNTLSAIIVEDEDKSSIVLQEMISDYCPFIDVVAAATSVKDAYAAITTLQPKLLFLDIEIIGGSAFDLLDKFTLFPFSVIFISAYDHYALKAIKHNAADYLLKPVNPDELTEAVEKVMAGSHTQQLQENMMRLLEQMRTPAAIARLAVPTLGGLLFADTDQLIYCKAEGSYTTLYFETEPKILASKNIKDFEQMLPGHFFRIHHSYIVNTKYIRKYVQGRGGYVIMSDGSEIEVSARRKEQFLALFR